MSSVILICAAAIQPALAADRVKTANGVLQSNAAAKNGVPAGLVEFLGLSPVQRRADYRSRVEKAVGEHPDDPAPQLAWLKYQR